MGKESFGMIKFNNLTNKILKKIMLIETDKIVGWLSPYIDIYKEGQEAPILQHNRKSGEQTSQRNLKIQSN